MQQLIEAPLTIERLASGVVLAKNFVKNEACKNLVATAEQDIHWTKAHVGHYKDDQLIAHRLDIKARDVEVGLLDEHLDSYINGFSYTTSSLIGQTFEVPNLTVEDFMMSRYSPGCHIKPHSDTGVYSTSRIVTCVQYLNNDFQGGNIFFPKLGISLSPSMGDLLMFWSECEHGVSIITEGVRYCIVCFAKAPGKFQLA